MRTPGLAGGSPPYPASAPTTSSRNLQFEFTSLLNVPALRINDIVQEWRGVSVDTAMRLARYFGGDARPWLNFQAACDLRVAEIQNIELIEREIIPAAA